MSPLLRSILCPTPEMEKQAVLGVMKSIAKAMYGAGKTVVKNPMKSVGVGFAGMEIGGAASGAGKAAVNARKMSSLPRLRGGGVTM